MIKLIKFRPAFGLPDPSPFCMKAMMLLRMAGLPFEAVEATNPRKGPKGKLPAIEDDGVLIGDSEIIRWHIESKYGIDLDKGMGEPERAVAHAFSRMLEERTYWIVVFSRWMEPASWPLVRDTFFGALPPVVRSIVPALAMRQVRGYLHAQGVGRHGRDEIYRMGLADIGALARQLGDKPYFMGAEPTGSDGTVYPFVAGIIDPPFDSPLKAECLGRKNLVAYNDRLRGRYFA